MSNFKLIVFDCDGTLVDSQHLIVHAMQRAFVDAGFPRPERQLILHTVGLSILESMRQLAPYEAPETHARLAAAYRDCCFGLRQEGRMQEPLFSGASALLRRLAASDSLVLGIATGKSRRGVDRLLEAEGFRGMFATIQTADDAPSKPHPAMLLQAMAETGAAPEGTIMIGDSIFDMTMAANAGVMAVAVGWGYCHPSQLQRAGAAHTVRSFAELGAFLDARCSLGASLAAAE